MAGSSLNAGQVTAVSPRIAELDGVRGLAVLMVLVWHFLGELIDTGLGTWAWWIFQITRLGRTGVDLFFVLSGVLITGIILDRQNDNTGFLASFYKRRGLRILPPYLALVAAYYALCFSGVLTDPGTISIWHYLTFTQTEWMATHGSWGPHELAVTWSVSVEEHYYIIFPLVLLFASRKAVPYLLLSIALASATFRAYLYFGLDESTYYSYVYPFSRLDGLALGGVVAWVVRQGRFRDRLARYDRVLFPSALLLVVALLGLVGWGLHRNGHAHMYSWGHMALAVAFSLLLLSILLYPGQRQMALLRTEPLRKLGAISYSLYLFHPLVLILVFKFAGEGPARLASLRDLVLLALAITGTWVVAAKVLLPLEQWAIAYGRRYSY